MRRAGKTLLAIVAAASVLLLSSSGPARRKSPARLRSRRQRKRRPAPRVQNVPGRRCTRRKRRFRRRSWRRGSGTRPGRRAIRGFAAGHARTVADDTAPAGGSSRSAIPAGRRRRHGRPTTGDGSSWAERKDLTDGQAVKFLTGSPGTAVYLNRTIHATQAAKLIVGIGGGEQLDAWLNGHHVASAETRLIFGRYGCSDGFEGTRVDQVLLDLDLKAGENTLVLRLASGGEPSFYFSTAPDPVPAFWKQLRRDFPAAENPLLELVHADWFETGGWFAAAGRSSKNN